MWFSSEKIERRDPATLPLASLQCICVTWTTGTSIPRVQKVQGTINILGQNSHDGHLLNIPWTAYIGDVILTIRRFYWKRELLYDNTDLTKNNGIPEQPHSASVGSAPTKRKMSLGAWNWPTCWKRAKKGASSVRREKYSNKTQKWSAVQLK